MDSKKSCYRCNHLKTQAVEEKFYWCAKGGIDGEIFEPNGKGKMTLWQKMKLYERQGMITKLSLRLEEAAADCKNYDGEP